MGVNIFPTIPNGKWGKINLNEESKKVKLDFNNPLIFNDWIKKLHQERKVDYSYGGFLEDKSNIWKDHYQKLSKAFIHLGTDYNVPEGSLVSLFDDGVVEDVFIDKDMNGGWGGRIMWGMSSGIHVIYGHLKHNIKFRVGQKCKKGDVVGKVAGITENGGWWPHIHVQIMKSEFVKSYPDQRDIDGYLPKDSKLLKYLVDPDKFIKVGGKNV